MEGRGERRKGSATPLTSLFPAEEAKKAAQKVNDSIVERHKELDQLNAFTADNNALKKLVQSLPDELSHDIMVPFGKAAFFPGKMIHTNEFLVLLGEGYYAERTSKQTVEILQRRGKALSSKVEALKSTIMDLQAEASFFNYTAAEAAEGLVEIREEYNEELPEKSFESEVSTLKQLHPFEDGKDKKSSQSEDFDTLMARLDELEKEEDQAASSEDEDASPEIPAAESHLQQATEKRSIHDGSVPGTELGKLQLQSFAEGEPSERNPRALNTENFEEKKNVASHKPKEKSHVTFASQSEVPDAAPRDHLERFGSSRTRKAFTGSVIERGYDIQSGPAAPQSGSSQEGSASTSSSKPVSRFKMQRANR